MCPDTSFSTIVAPKPESEEERIKEYRSLKPFDTLSEGEFDALTRICRKLCDVPVSVINLLDEKRQLTKAASGVSADTLTTMPRSESVCQYTILEKEIMEIPDLIRGIVTETPFRNTNAREWS